MAELPKIDPSWTLFLDRDGVINKLIPGQYIERWEQFEFLPGVMKSFPALNGMFGRIIVVTNQQGVGKGIMTASALAQIHENMKREIVAGGGRLDGIYSCPHLAEEGCSCRKPKAGMPLEAKKSFPGINFSKSIIVGDSDVDVQMGMELGMFTVLLPSVLGQSEIPDMRLESLAELVKRLSRKT